MTGYQVTDSRSWQWWHQSYHRIRRTPSSKPTNSLLFLGLLFLFSLLGTVLASDADGCASGWSYFSGNCYQVVESPRVTNLEAKNECIALAPSVAVRSRLASVHSAEENDFILRLRGKSFSLWLDGGDHGAADWFHTDTTAFDFADWEPDRTSSASGAQAPSCVFIWGAAGNDFNFDVEGGDDHWAAGPCELRLSYVCKYWSGFAASLGPPNGTLTNFTRIVTTSVSYVNSQPSSDNPQSSVGGLAEVTSTVTSTVVDFTPYATTHTGPILIYTELYTPPFTTLPYTLTWMNTSASQADSTTINITDPPAFASGTAANAGSSAGWTNTRTLVYSAQAKKRLRITFPVPSWSMRRLWVGTLSPCKPSVMPPLHAACVESTGSWCPISLTCQLVFKETGTFCGPQHTCDQGKCIGGSYLPLARAPFVADLVAWSYPAADGALAVAVSQKNQSTAATSVNLFPLSSCRPANTIVPLSSTDKIITTQRGLTISSWVFVSAYHKANTIIYLSTGTTFHSVWLTGPWLQAWFSGVSNSSDYYGQLSLQAPTPIPTCTWTHVAVSWDPQGHINLYINGTLDASYATCNSVDPVAPSNMCTAAGLRVVAKIPFFGFASLWYPGRVSSVQRDGLTVTFDNGQVWPGIKRRWTYYCPENVTLFASGEPDSDCLPCVSCSALTTEDGQSFFGAGVLGGSVQAFDGGLTGFRVHNRSLSAAEVAALFAGPLQGSITATASGTLTQSVTASAARTTTTTNSQTVTLSRGLQTSAPNKPESKNNSGLSKLLIVAISSVAVFFTLCFFVYLLRHWNKVARERITDNLPMSTGQPRVTAAFVAQPKAAFLQQQPYPHLQQMSTPGTTAATILHAPVTPKGAYYTGPEPPPRPFPNSTQPDSFDIGRTLSISGPEWRKGELSTALREQRDDRFAKSDRILGRGGFGDVYLGVDNFSGQLVAIKVSTLRSGIQTEMAEVRMLQGLKHPHIVSYIDYWISNECMIIVMEYIAGGSLYQILREFSRLALPSLSVYMRHVLSGLQYLHENNVVHCDIKPHNILLDPRGHCKLSDFGAAVLVNGPTRFAGTPIYMAPERCSVPPTAASDIWSLGITTLELATGRHPYKQSCMQLTDPATMLQHIKDLGPPAQHCELLNTDLQHFILDCTQLNPDRRPTVSHLLAYKFISPLFSLNRPLSPLREAQGQFSSLSNASEPSKPVESQRQ